MKSDCYFTSTDPPDATTFSVGVAIPTVSFHPAYLSSSSLPCLTCGKNPTRLMTPYIIPILASQLQDLNDLEGHYQTQDVLTDEQLALRLYREELRRYATTLPDHRIGTYSVNRQIPMITYRYSRSMAIQCSVSQLRFLISPQRPHWTPATILLSKSPPIRGLKLQRKPMLQ